MRDLVPLSAPASPLDRPVPGRGPRPAASFLAHLIATAQQAPQTRTRRRAEPADAAARYSSATDGAAALRMPSWSI